MQIYDDLIKAKENWQLRNYSFHVYKNMMEQRRDNEINAIDNLLFMYNNHKMLSESEIRFAQKLIANSRK